MNIGKGKTHLPNLPNYVRSSSFSHEWNRCSQDSKQGLNLLEQQMLELKIYLPYFISNEAIIQN
jgi:hypothetical protein